MAALPPAAMALACLVAVTEYCGKQLWEGILVLPHGRRPLRPGWTAYVAFRLVTWLLYCTSLGGCNSFTTYMSAGSGRW